MMRRFRKWLKQALCRHRDQRYVGQREVPYGYRVVAVRCQRCGKVERAKGIGKVVWESP